MAVQRSSLRKMLGLIIFICSLLIINGLFFSYQCIWLVENYNVGIPISAAVTFFLQLVLTAMVAYSRLGKRWKGCFSFSSSKTTKCLSLGDFRKPQKSGTKINIKTPMKKALLYLFFCLNQCAHSVLLQVFSALYVRGNWMQPDRAKITCTIVVLVTAFLMSLLSLIYLGLHIVRFCTIVKKTGHIHKNRRIYRKATRAPVNQKVIGMFTLYQLQNPA